MSGPGPDPPSFDRQAFVTSVVVADRVCGIEGCSAPVAATYAMVRQVQDEPRRVAYQMVWGCEEHKVDLELLARRNMADGVVVTGWTQELVTSCLAPGCGADATHAVFVARDYGPNARRMEAMSVCGPHAAEIERGLPPAA